MIPARGVFLVLPFLIACGSKWSFEDGDGDGVSAAEGDCWDRTDGPEGSGLKGSDIFPGAEETWYDGIDQNCNGDDDYDADGDGYIQEIHVGLGTEGIEESGFLPPGDCWDEPVGPLDGALSGERINPASEDTWYDGIDQDCSGNDDFDADGDGYATMVVDYGETIPIEDSGSLPEGDCMDLPSGSTTVDGGSIAGHLIHPDAEDAWYDGVDQDCASDDDFDQDGDGYRSGVEADQSGDYGLDCLDDSSEVDLPVVYSFQVGIDGTGLTNAEVLAHFGLTPADFNPDAVDDAYDGFDLNCDQYNDCDVDGDGWDAAGPDAPFCGDEPTAPLCSVVACENVDCDDTDASIRPTDGVAEIYYNGIDDNCNLELDGDGDQDGDGFWSMDYYTLVPGSTLEIPFEKDGDCNDDNPLIAPGLYDEPYDGLDGDCLGDDDFDQDRDGFVKTGHFGDVTEYALGAGALPGTGIMPGGDCRDLEPLVNPAMNENCHTSYDDDCDEDLNDEDAEFCDIFFADRDGDSFGKPGDSKCYCDERDEYTVFGSDDCDDESSSTHPGIATKEEDPTLCMKDDDGDGFGDSASIGPIVGGTDCDDTIAAVSPDGTETCGTDYDDDCDGDANDLDATFCTNYFADRDGDTYGDPDSVECRCEVSGDFNQLDSEDCDDTSDAAASTYPGAAESEPLRACHKDVDGDGFGDSSSGPFTPGQDCDDDRSLVNPDVNENCATDYDDDCDADINDEGAASCTVFFADRDDDDYGKPGDSACHCTVFEEYNETNSDDCDDGSSQTYPGAAYEESSECMKDSDGDGFGDDTVSSPVVPGEDCDDARSGVNPDVNEDCDTTYDDDCDGDTNDQNADDCDIFFADRDGDTYGVPGDSKCYCDERGVYSQENDDDCDDDSHLTHPGAAEHESGTSCRKDEDEDGYGDSSPSSSGVTGGTDCDDSNASRHPTAPERCGTAYDDDCDEDTNDLGASGCHLVYADGDLDGYGDPDDSECRCDTTTAYAYEDASDCDPSSASTHPGAAENESSTSCRKDSDFDGYGDDAPPAGVTAGTDCNDSPLTGSTISPAGTEDCGTAADDDCDGSTNDLNAIDCDPWYLDADGDGYGNASFSRCYCSASASYTSSAALATDCDDSDGSIHPFATDTCDDVDSDCDGSYTEDVYPDFDGDGMPDCSDPDADGDGYSGLADCYDLDPTMYDGAPESCDMTDSDCDGSYVDEFADVDGDEIPDCVDDEDGDGYPLLTDCDDDDASVNPGVSGDSAFTLGVDNDCDGFVDEDTIFDLLDEGRDVLFFSELQVNPTGTFADERNKEWFELTNVSGVTLYLDNWVFDMTDTDCLDGVSCDQFTVFPGSDVQVESGETVLFCRRPSYVNAALFSSGSSEVCDYGYGSRPAGATGSTYHDAGYRMFNEAISSLHLSIDGEEVDSVDHMVFGWPAAEDTILEDNRGRSFMFDGALIGASGVSEVEENDIGGNWCHTRLLIYAFDFEAAGTGDHNYGTPGELNPTCVVADP